MRTITLNRATFVVDVWSDAIASALQAEAAGLTAALEAGRHPAMRTAEVRLQQEAPRGCCGQPHLSLIADGTRLDRFTLRPGCLEAPAARARRAPLRRMAALSLEQVPAGLTAAQPADLLVFVRAAQAPAVVLTAQQLYEVWVAEGGDDRLREAFEAAAASFSTDESSRVVLIALTSAYLRALSRPPLSERRNLSVTHARAIALYREADGRRAIVATE